MKKKDMLRIPDYLEHILEALNRIFDYIDEIDELSFVASPLIQDAVIRNLEIIGEASRNLLRFHTDFTEKYPEVPWEDMYWMRNRISHGYFSIDCNSSARTVKGGSELLLSILKSFGKQLS
jgi:uncharacterized protein with HEPN domain